MKSNLSGLQEIGIDYEMDAARLSTCDVDCFVKYRSLFAYGRQLSAQLSTQFCD